MPSLVQPRVPSPLAAPAVLAFTLLVGCGGGSGSDGEPTSDTAARDGNAVSVYALPDVDVPSAVADLPPVTVLPEVKEHLDGYVAGCHFDLDGRYMNQCPSDVKGPFEDWVRAEKSSALFESLAELAVAGDSTEMQIAASSLLDSLRSTVQYPWLTENATDAMALRAIRLLREATTPSETSRAAAVAVQLGWATDHGDLVVRAVHEHPETSARTSGFDQMMQFGSLEGFRFMRWEAERDDSLVRDVLSAILADELDDQEKAEACPWAEGHLAAEDSYRALDAANVLLDCGTETVPTILADGERRLAAGTIDSVTVNIYREPCFVYREQPEPAQCEAVYSFLEKIGNTETLPSDVRGTALWNIYYQRRTEETATLLDQYADHQDEVIRDRVRSAIDAIRG